MVRLKEAPDIFDSYIPPEPPRAIVVSTSTMAFASAVYQLGLEPHSAWRAVSVEQATEMQAAWLAEGVKSYLVPLPDDLRALEADEPTVSPRRGAQHSYQSFERGSEGDEAIAEDAEGAEAA